MSIILLKKVIRKMHFENDLTSIKEMEFSLEVKQNTRVDFDKEHNRLACVMNVHIAEKRNDPKYVLAVEMLGLFESDVEINDDNRKDLHIEASKKLYPFLMETVASISGKSGITPIILKPLNITNDKIEVTED